MEYRKYKNEMVEKYLGEELFAKYSEIRPFVYLLFYRAISSWKEGLFLGEIMGSAGITKNVAELLQICGKRVIKFPVYLYKKILLMKTDFGKTYISDALLSIDRYNDNLLEMINDKLIIGGITIDKIRFRMDDEITRQKYSVMKVFWGGSISGYKLCNMANKCMKCIKSMIDDFDVSKRDQLDYLLFEFEQEIKKRVRRIKKILKKYQIKQFVTSNQYNLNDYLCVAACKELGIKTTELFHYACSLYAGLSNDFFSYTDEDCVWDKEDKNAYLERKKMVFFSTNVSLKVVGNPEVNFMEMKKNMDIYPRQRALVLFAPTIFDENELNDCLRQHESLYHAVAKFAGENGYIVYIKYHPADFERLVSLEADILKENQFILCQNTPTSLIEVCCRSCIAIGYRTTAMKVAYAYGCKCYNLVMDEEEYYNHNLLDIRTIYIDDISEMSLIDVSDIHPRYESALNISMLFC